MNDSYSLGRMFQCFIVPSDAVYAAECTIPLDDVSTGVFKVVGFLDHYHKLAYRKI
jgi:hypothetical protein